MEDSSCLSSTVVHDGVPNMLDCQICRSPPRNPVATSCGHMCCWPCLHRHLQGRQQPCSVCGTVFRIVPVYGVDTFGDDSAGYGIPPRPVNTPPPVPTPLPTPSEVREAFAVIEMVNERLRVEKSQALQAITDRFQTLFSLLRGLPIRQGTRHDKNWARTRISAVYGAMKKIGEQLKELWIIRRRFEKMLHFVTRVGGNADVWWDQGTPVVISVH